jgi:RNA polymerase sigma-70 factor (ECF subfamily)
VLDRALALGGRGQYTLQAAIASLHTQEKRDWAQIGTLYRELARLTSSPVVELNLAIAVAEDRGPQAGLDLLDRLPLDEFHYLHCARAELLARLGRLEEARAAYRRALALAPDDAERPLIERRLAELDSAESAAAAETARSSV